MTISQARDEGLGRSLTVFMNDPFGSDNTFKIFPNEWTGAMDGTYTYYPSTGSIVFYKYARPGEPEDEIRMRWDFINYPDDCRAGAAKSGDGEIYTNFSPGVAVSIQWSTGS
jgi:hypothetical protein